MEFDSRLTLRQMELFVAVADTGGFAAAAESLHLTPNAVAQAVTELERNLGAGLTVRHRARGVTLTPTGVRLAAGARVLLRDVGELALTIGEDSARIRGPVAIGCYGPLAPTLMSQVWAGVAQAHPEIELTIVDGTSFELTEMVGRGSLDLVIAYAVSLPAGLTTHPLFYASPKVSLPADHPTAARTAVDLADLADESLILLDKPPSGQNTLNILHRRGIDPKVVQRTSEFELMRSLVARGAGYGIHFLDVNSETTREGLPIVTRPILPASEREPVVVAWQTGVRMPRRVEAVVQVCHDQLSSGAASATDSAGPA